MAVVFPQGIEVFSNVASCVAAAGSGGTNGTSNPAAGTTESWTVSTGSTSFPVANFTSWPTTSSPPGNYFYVSDPADTTHEIILVYNNNSSGSPGTSWSVQRGMNGATVAHASGATYVQVVSPFSLQNMKQAPGNMSSAVSTSGTTETVLASYTPVSTDIAQGTSYRVIAFGALGWAAVPTLQIRLLWGGSGSVGGAYTIGSGVQLAMIKTATNCPALTPTTATINSSTAGHSFDVEGSITLLSTTTATCNMNMWYTGSSLTVTTVNCSTVNTNSSGSSLSTPVTISGSGPIFLTAAFTGGTTPALTATAPLIFRDT